jgi:hypothetical protein
MAKPTDAEWQRDGRLGGLETSGQHGRDFVERRGSKVGVTTRTLYGSGFFRHIQRLRWGRKKP